MPGQYYDSETGLFYNYFRYYDPRTGRYITADPIGLSAGLNVYRYAYNNPLSWVDVLGLDETRWANSDGGRSVWNGPTNGNWGGGCWSGGQGSCGDKGMGSEPPTDSGDACYKGHDEGWNKCQNDESCKNQCNKNLVSCLKKLSDDPKKWPVPPTPGTEGDSSRFRQGAIMLFGE